MLGIGFLFSSCEKDLIEHPNDFDSSQKDAIFSNDCGECDGKIDQLQLLYNGSRVATIVVETKKKGLNQAEVKELLAQNDKLWQDKMGGALTEFKNKIQKTQDKYKTEMETKQKNHHCKKYRSSLHK